MNLLLQEFVTIFGVSAAVVILLHFLKQPPIAGFVITGILVGPSGFGWIEDTVRIHVLAEIGLIFLLFSIGIEFSIKSLSSMRRAFLGVGSLQVLITAALICALLFLYGFTFSTALLMGFLVSLSSTAITLNMLHRKRELSSPQGKLSVAVIIFQDLFAIPLLLLLPLFSATMVSNTVLILDLTSTLARAFLLLLITFLGSRYIVPRVLRFITGTGIRELFLITVALIAFGSAWIGFQLGLSLVFGAFLAGMLVSETHYGHQVVADLIPLRDPFVAIFFVSVGMLLDLNHFMLHWEFILLAAAIVIIVKFVVSATSGIIMKYDIRVSVLMGLLISQIGEFSFVVIEAAFQTGALTAFDYQHFLSISIVTMLINPSLVHFVPNALTTLEKKFFSQNKRHFAPKLRESHAIIIGLGVIGHNLTSLLAKHAIGFVGIDSDPKAFEQISAESQSAIFGDGAKAEILEAADIRRAQLVVVAINDASWTAQIVASVRRLRPDIRIIVRCHKFEDMQKLADLKVDDFVVAEAQMTVEFSERVLRHFEIDDEIIEEMIERTKRLNDV